MRRLYVGCRVRLVYRVSAENFGSTGRITSFAESEIGTPVVGGFLDRHCDCEVLYDGDSLESLEQSDRLEPIQDPGREVISWSEMKDLWQPQGETA